MVCKQCGTKVKIGQNFCSSCGEKIKTVEEWHTFFLLSILKVCHIASCIIASIGLFVSFVLNHNQAATLIMLYDIPIFVASFYYCLGLNPIWYVGMLAFLRKSSVPTIIEQSILFAFSCSVIVLDLTMDFNAIRGPVFILLKFIVESFFPCSVLILVCVCISFVAKMAHGIIKKKGDLKDANL